MRSSPGHDLLRFRRQASREEPGTNACGRVIVHAHGVVPSLICPHRGRERVAQVPQQHMALRCLGEGSGYETAPDRCTMQSAAYRRRSYRAVAPARFEIMFGYGLACTCWKSCVRLSSRPCDLLETPLHPIVLKDLRVYPILDDYSRPQEASNPAPKAHDGVRRARGLCVTADASQAWLPLARRVCGEASACRGNPDVADTCLPAGTWRSPQRTRSLLRSTIRSSTGDMRPLRQGKLCHDSLKDTEASPVGPSSGPCAKPRRGDVAGIALPHWPCINTSPVARASSARSTGELSRVASAIIPQENASLRQEHEVPGVLDDAPCHVAPIGRTPRLPERERSACFVAVEGV